MPSVLVLRHATNCDEGSTQFISSSKFCILKVFNLSMGSMCQHFAPLDFPQSTIEGIDSHSELIDASDAACSLYRRPACNHPGALNRTMLQ